MEGFDETYTVARRRPPAANRDTDRERSRSGGRAADKNPTDWLVRLSAVQLTLACIGVVLLLLISKASPKTFDTLKAEFHSIMTVDMNAKEVLQSFKGIGKKINASAAVPTAEIASQQEKEITSEQESQTQEESTAPDGTGGEDTELYAATTSVCFAPFNTTVPMILPVSGEITSHFGYRTHPITGKFGIHNGTDFSAEEGTPIAAALDGTVEEVGCNKVRGNYIVLSHGGDTKTVYMHCSEIVAPENAVIRQGEFIAKVGNTGLSTGAHLHFSIIIGGKYCNPEWLQA